MSDRERLVRELSHTLQEVSATGDGTPLLDDRVYEIARELADDLTRGPVSATVPGTAEALAVLVGTHWLRYRGLPSGQDQDDLRACIAWSALLLPIQPDLVPQPVRAYLAEHGAPEPAEDQYDADDPVQRGARLYQLYQRTGNLPLLDAAIGCFLQAVGAAGPASPDRSELLGTLGALLLDHSRHVGGELELDQAIGYYQAAADATGHGAPERSRRLANLGNALRLRFERDGAETDLDQAIAACREAVELAPVGDPARPAMLVNLGSALQWRFERTGLPADLAATVERFREAATATPARHPDRRMTHAALGSALMVGYEHTGRESDLDEAIRYLRVAVDASPVADQHRATAAANLGTALWNRFRRTGQRLDLDQAVRYLREAVTSTPAGNTERPSRLSSLGSVLQTMFELTGEDARQDEAIEAGREALSTAPAGHPYQQAMLTNLGLALRSRSARTGSAADLDEALGCLRAAADATPEDHALRPTALANVGAALRARFIRTGQSADLDEAIARTQAAAGIAPADHPDRVSFLFNLGQALRARFEVRDQEPDRDAAMAAFRAAAAAETGSPAQRVRSAIGLAEFAMEAGRPEDALPGYQAAVALLPLAVWHGLDQKTREQRLGEWAGLGRDAAAAAVAAGKPLAAIELLEQGRNVLWTQALRLRQDLSALRDQAPELAVRLEAGGAVLNDSPSFRGVHDEIRVFDQRRLAARDWDAALAQVRKIAGFQDFLRPVSFAGLRDAASGGPVAIVNVSRHGSHALIVTPPGDRPIAQAVMVVDLPEARVSTVVDQANVLLTALFNAEDPDASAATARSARNAIFDVLEWSWRAIAEPVLSALGWTSTPAGEPEGWPRLWWCPTGPAAVLPLHAAGRYPRAGARSPGAAGALADSVPGRAVCSYAQTLTSLIRARSRPSPGNVRQLAVGVPDTSGYAGESGYLPAVAPELAAVGRHLPEPGFATHLLGPAASKGAVTAALPAYAWLHLSCHGIQHPEDASLSAFLLHDQPLTVADIAALNLPSPDFAYLAACQTAAGSRQLLDEALHLAGALQLAGYRHVLASLWSISDWAALTMAEVTYDHLLDGVLGHARLPGPAQTARVPYALHRAAARLRDDHPGQPHLWAPYIHLGP